MFKSSMFTPNQPCFYFVRWFLPSIVGDEVASLSAFQLHCILLSHHKKPLPPLPEGIYFGTALLKLLPWRAQHSYITYQPTDFSAGVDCMQIIVPASFAHSLTGRTTTSSFAFVNNYGKPSQMTKTRVYFLLHVTKKDWGSAWSTVNV